MNIILCRNAENSKSPVNAYLGWLLIDTLCEFSLSRTVSTFCEGFPELGRRIIYRPTACNRHPPLACVVNCPLVSGVLSMCYWLANVNGFICNSQAMYSLAHRVSWNLQRMKWLQYTSVSIPIPIKSADFQVSKA